MSQFHDTIVETRAQLKRAAATEHVVLSPDALAFLNGALIEPGTTNVSVQGGELYEAARGAFQTLKSHYGDVTSIDMEDIAALYWRLPPPWGKA